jgi:hypothetical protein
VITEHTICALPEDNVNYWHYAIQVAYRGDGLWAVLNGGFCLVLQPGMLTLAERRLVPVGIAGQPPSIMDGCVD